MPKPLPVPPATRATAADHSLQKPLDQSTHPLKFSPTCPASLVWPSPAQHARPYRAYATVGSESKYGSTETKLVVRRTVSLTPSLPRIARSGDAFEAGVLVTLVDPTAAPEGGLTVTISLAIDDSVDSGADPVIVAMPVSAPGGVAGAAVTVAPGAGAGGKRRLAGADDGRAARRTVVLSKDQVRCAVPCWAAPAVVGLHTTGEVKWDVIQRACGEWPHGNHTLDPPLAVLCRRCRLPAVLKLRCAPALWCHAHCCAVPVPQVPHHVTFPLRCGLCRAVWCLVPPCR